MSSARGSINCVFPLEQFERHFSRVFTMSNLSKLEFVALDITGNNYLSWVLDAEIHLETKGLGDTIKQGNKSSSQGKVNAMIFLRHHLDEGLKIEYLTVKDPLELWNNLKDRYEYLKLTVLPKARYGWMHLRLQDFKTVTDYNSAIHQVSYVLKLCGETITDEHLLEKTFTTFHASNVLLQQQYYEKGFKKYADLISCLLVAKQNNTLLMKNHESPPIGSAPFPEVNAVTGYDKPERRQNNYRGRDHGRGSGRGRERGRHNYRQHGKNKQETNKGSQNNPSTGKVNMCHRCGMKGHWARICRTPDHFVKLYQGSLKGRENNVEAHLTFHNNDDEAAPSNKHDDIKENLAYKDDDFKSLSNITHLEAGDFYDDID
ncbi:uncharacterized protein LOC132633806 isoform X1 [Lycium barbarum]|uniref:uncharacterized protein LOC132633806 isoform X1 n=1 Tax=Lycium barbarum TaxID=112863 RepID=UPI00293EB5F8|nr:uncharacterized protein LOC132633806 isoform X1 [Lycium barbarum]